MKTNLSIKDELLSAIRRIVAKFWAQVVGQSMRLQSVGYHANFGAKIGIRSRIASRMLLSTLLMLTVCIGNVWADMVTYTFNSRFFGTSESAWTYQQAGNSYVAAQGVQCMTSMKGEATTKSSFSDVRAVIVKYSTNSKSGAGTIQIKIGDNAVTSNAVNDDGGTDVRATSFFYSTPQTGAVKVKGNVTENSIWIYSVTIIYGTNSTCNDIDVSGGETVILPKGVDSYTAYDWKNNGAPSSYAEGSVYSISDDNYCVFLYNAGDMSTTGLQFKAYGGMLIIDNIASAAGVMVDVDLSATSAAKGFSIALTGASTISGQYSGTSHIETTSTNASLVISNPTDGAGYVKTITITPNCTPPATELSITSANTVAMGNTITLTSADGNGNTVTWDVEAGTGSGTISAGVFTPTSAGTVTIKAHQDMKTVSTIDYCPQDIEQEVTITVNVSSVSVDPTSKGIIPGETFTITPTVLPAEATDQSVSWTSSATGKATVNANGVVTGVAAGSATITCTTTNGSKTADCAVTIYGVSLAATDDSGDALPGGGPGSPTRDGINISPAANAGGYVFKEWQISGASLGSSATTKNNTITSPTGAVTVTAIYYSRKSVTWLVDGEEWTAGNPSTAVDGGTQYKDLTYPTDPTTEDGCGDRFVGWTTANMGATLGQSAPGVLLTSDNRGSNTTEITADVVFRAVFADYDD